MSNIDNRQDIIDSRDIIARIEELESDRETLSDAVTDAKETLAEVAPEDAEKEYMQELQQAVTDAEEALADWEDAEEFKALQGLAEEAEGSGDWAHGETLIRDSHFKQYAMDFADEIGAVDSSASWPNTCIDWDQAADELQQDYTSVDYDGVTYWLRS